MALLIIVDYIQLEHEGKAYIDQQMIVNSIIYYILYTGKRSWQQQCNGTRGCQEII